jgi:hypothetical protein
MIWAGHDALTGARKALRIAADEKLILKSRIRGVRWRLAVKFQPVTGVF